MLFLSEGIKRNWTRISKVFISYFVKEKRRVRRGKQTDIKYHYNSFVAPSPSRSLLKNLKNSVFTDGNFATLWIPSIQQSFSKSSRDKIQKILWNAFSFLFYDSMEGEIPFEDSHFHHLESHKFIKFSIGLRFNFRSLILNEFPGKLSLNCSPP